VRGEKKSGKAYTAHLKKRSQNGNYFTDEREPANKGKQGLKTREGPDGLFSRGKAERFFNNEQRLLQNQTKSGSTARSKRSNRGEETSFKLVSKERKGQLGLETTPRGTRREVHLKPDMKKTLQSSRGGEKESSGRESLKR